MPTKPYLICLLLFLSGLQLYGQIPYNINSYGGELEGTDFKVYFEVGVFASGQISGNQLQLSHMLHPVFDKKTNVLSIPGGNDIIKVYPNPFISKITIESAEESFDQVVVISLMGEIVISKNTDTSTMDLSRLPAGLYILKVYNAGKELGHFKITKL